MAERILVAEDEATLRGNIRRFLSKQGHDVIAVGDGDSALKEIEERDLDVVLTDLRLPGADGLEILDCVRRASPDTPVLIMTAYASLSSAVEALRRGAHDYMLKPLSLAALGTKIERIAQYRALGRENARLRQLVRDDGDPIALLRLESRVMRELCEIIVKVAPSSSNVLIQGESGTGKELVAHAIHDLSKRHAGPFVPVNVSAIPENLVESTLFGHERGAFTGADRRREGLFRAADGGTLFLDEIGELPLAVQAKLLRAVETKEVLPVGSDRGVKVDTRIVSASHRDLSAMVGRREFREDLLYRMRVVMLDVPPLRERTEDLPLLLTRFIEKQAREQNKAVHGVDGDAIQCLMRYRWPGNVRELSNVVERAVLLCDRATLGVEDLPREIRGDGFDADGGNLEKAMSEFERSHIASVLASCGGNRESAARLLGISPATLYRRLEKLDLKGYRGGSGIKSSQG